jgi:uncharacterized membrane protein YfcA
VSTGVLAAAITVILLAGSLQRLSGVGFALVASPIMMVAVGPGEAVRLVIVTSLVSSTFSLWATHRDSRPREVLPLLPFAIFAIWPAAVLAKSMSAAASSIVAGVIVLVTLGVAARPRRVPGRFSWSQAAIAGTLSGAMNAVAALGGPMAASYGISRRWGPSLVPNMHLFLLVASLAVLLVRGWPQETGTVQLVALMASAAAGAAMGGWLASGVAPRTANILTTGVASVGACAAIAQGFSGLV